MQIVVFWPFVMRQNCVYVFDEQKQTVDSDMRFIIPIYASFLGSQCTLAHLLSIINFRNELYSLEPIYHPFENVELVFVIVLTFECNQNATNVNKVRTRCSHVRALSTLI